LKHVATRHFWLAYDALPASVRALADKNFALLKTNPSHSSIRLKQVGRFWSARVGLGYRALALESETGLVWFWIGSHAEYDQLVRR
jgi:hypothetical protein